MNHDTRRGRRDRSCPWLLALGALTVGAAGARQQDPAPQPPELAADAAASDEPQGIVWDARAVEHLLNRAAFGARPRTIQAWVERSPEELVEHLLAEREGVELFFAEERRIVGPEVRKLPIKERQQVLAKARRGDQRQLQAFLAWWMTEMVEGEDPLRERMTLFWHGFFTSGFATVRNSRAMIRQNQLLRENATGSYAELLAAVLRDPAMLRYLDNVSNRKQRPNENLAREVMELFSLGEGNYTESDVKNAARALTGHGVSREGEYRFLPRQHDGRMKQILGVKGRHDAADLVGILLAQEACARFVAGELITYFEGVAPSEQRLERYASLLRENGYRIEPMLRTLFLDPAFYREEIVGARVLSPVEYLVGSSRRLGLRRVPAQFLVAGATLLGQKLLDPPNVKGWEEGEAWISTSSLMLRGNLMGMLLGRVDLADISGVDARDGWDMMDGDRAAADVPDEPRMDPAPPLEEKTRRPARRQGEQSALARILRGMNRVGFEPQINLSDRVARLGLVTDAEVVDHMLDELLAIEPPAETRATLIEYLERERRPLGPGPYDNLPRRETEALLRRLAYLILSLPEAQLG